jgi:hypothetical protein
MTTFSAAGFCCSLVFDATLIWVEIFCFASYLVAFDVVCNVVASLVKSVAHTNDLIVLCITTI